MPIDEYAISDLTLSSGITNNDLIELATPDQTSETGYGSVSATVVQMATKMLKGIQFTSDLNTTDKTIIGAINEILASGGASILYGTTAPTAQQGVNGNLYVKYTAGTGGASDTVDNLYVKLDGAWCEISTGGTGSTTLAGLTDVSLSSPADKEVLQYDGTAQKWKNKSTSIEKTIQNVAIATFPDGADNVPLSELEVEIEPNLSGVSSVNVYRIGKNLFNKATITSGKFITNTGAEYSTMSGCYSDYIPIKLNTDYYFSHIVGAGQFYSIAVYDKSKNFIEVKNLSGNIDSSGSMTFTQGAYIRVNIGLSYIDTCQIELGNTATTYETYNGTTYTIDFSNL